MYQERESFCNAFPSAPLELEIPFIEIHLLNYTTPFCFFQVQIAKSRSFFTFFYLQKQKKMVE